MAQASPSALMIRQLAEQDIPAIDLLLKASYGDSENRIPRIQRYQRLQPDGWFVAMLDDAPAGVVGAIDYGPFAYSGLLGVHPYAQRKGIGTALMTQIVNWLDQRHCPMVLLDATSASVPLYRKLGFVMDDKVTLFQLDHVIETRTAPPNVRLMRAEDIPALSAFDAPIFGAPRRTVLEAVLSECPGRAFVAHDDHDEIAGYVFAQANVLGPWATTTPDTAEALLAAALPCYAGRAARVIVPGANTTAQALLQRYGFHPQAERRHLRRGGVAHPGDRAHLYAQVSFVIG